MSAPDDEELVVVPVSPAGALAFCAAMAERARTIHFAMTHAEAEAWCDSVLAAAGVEPEPEPAPTPEFCRPPKET